MAKLPSSPGSPLPLPRATPAAKGPLALALALPLLLLFLLAQAPVAPARVVTTTYGQVQGSEANGIEYFRGIPYGAPPTGSRRWRPPARAASWKGVRNATAYGNQCVQAQMGPPGGGGIPGGGAAPGGAPGGAQPPFGGGLAQSEDCLNLNVYAPKGAEGLPVMVWIHGGGFQIGTGADSQWDGTVWIPQLSQPVVLVTINYRLNLFGFLGSWQLRVERGLNLGLLDQQLAFRWVRENIKKFGGNPKDVTAFGESAGAVSLGCQLLYRGGTQRLFDRAIMQSGSYPSLFTNDLHSVAKAQRNFDYVAGKVGCNATKRGWKGWRGGMRVLQCLRGVNATALSMAAPPSPSYGKLNFSPILALPFFARLPATQVRFGFISYRPIIAGTNGNEGLFFYQSSGGNVTSKAAFNSFVKEYLPQLSAADREKTAKLYDADKYFFGLHARAAQEIIGDTKFVCNSEYLAKGSTRLQRRVFRYNFNYTIGGQQATHGQELNYVWPAAGSSLNLNNNIFLSAWPRFAYKGAPLADSAKWPSYSQGKQILLDSSTSRSVVVAPAIHRERCAFWRSMEAKYYKVLVA